MLLIADRESISLAQRLDQKTNVLESSCIVSMPLIFGTFDQAKVQTIEKLVHMIVQYSYVKSLTLSNPIRLCFCLEIGAISDTRLGLAGAIWA